MCDSKSTGRNSPTRSSCSPCRSPQDTCTSRVQHSRHYSDDRHSVLPGNHLVGSLRKTMLGSTATLQLVTVSSNRWVQDPCCQNRVELRMCCVSTSVAADERKPGPCCECCPYATGNLSHFNATTSTVLCLTRRYRSHSDFQSYQHPHDAK